MEGIMNVPRAFRSRCYVGLVVVAWLAVSCAGPNKLAEQSEKAYGKGELEKAYKKAARALQKDPENRRARAAMTQVAARLLDERQTEVRGLAIRDTVAAANRALALDAFRTELTDYRIILPADPEFDRDETQILIGAAGIKYRAGLDDLEQDAPKSAYGAFQMVQAYQPRYRDVDRKLEQAMDEALPRVAFLPFVNETDLEPLSRGFYERAYLEIGHRVLTQGFRFTALLPRERIYEMVPVARLDRMSRREAARIGRALGADRVVIGRFYALRTNTNTGNFTQTVYQKYADKDEKGFSRDRYREHTIDILTRDRELSVSYEYQVIDVERGTAIVGNSGSLRAAAHAIFTSRPVGGDNDDYCLVSPDLEKSDPDRAKRIQSEWKDRCGDWKLTELIDRSRKERSRSRYESRYADDWALRSDGCAMFLGDVPPEGELVKMAFGQVWEPMTRTLKELDQSEPREYLGERP